MSTKVNIIEALFQRTLCDIFLHALRSLTNKDTSVFGQKKEKGEIGPNLMCQGKIAKRAENFNRSEIEAKLYENMTLQF